MKTDRLYIATISIVLKQNFSNNEYLNTITTSITRPFDTKLLYKKNDCYYDFVTNDQYNVGCDYCKEGDLFINLDYPIYKLTEYLNKPNISKRKLIKMYKSKK